MAASDSFADLMVRLRSGDSNAAAELHARFIQRLIALASQRFDSRARARADHEDVVQSVFKSFFVRFEQGRFDLGGWDDLWGLLVVMTLRKCGHQRTYLRAGRRDAAREVPFALLADGSSGEWLPIDREPTPDEAAMLSETVEQWLLDLEPSDREIMELGLQGLTSHEIAARLHRSERTVRRVRQRVEDRLLASFTR